MPKASELPESLKGLARRQGTEVSPARFDADVEKLTRALGSILDERRRRDAAEAEAAEEQVRARNAAEAERAAHEERERREAAEAVRAEQTRRLAEAEAARGAAEVRRLKEAAEAERAAREREAAEDRTVRVSGPWIVAPRPMPEKLQRVFQEREKDRALQRWRMWIYLGFWGLAILAGILMMHFLPRN